MNNNKGTSKTQKCINRKVDAAEENYEYKISQEERMIALYESELQSMQDSFGKALHDCRPVYGEKSTILCSKSNFDKDKVIDNGDNDDDKDDPFEWILGSTASSLSTVPKLAAGYLANDNHDTVSDLFENDNEEILALQPLLRGFCFTQVDRLRQNNATPNLRQKQNEKLHYNSTKRLKALATLSTPGKYDTCGSDAKVVSYRLRGHFTVQGESCENEALHSSNSKLLMAEFRLVFEIPTLQVHKQAFNPKALKRAPKMVSMNAKLLDSNYAWLNREINDTWLRSSIYENSLSEWITAVNNYLKFDQRRRNFLCQLKNDCRLDLDTVNFAKLQNSGNSNSVIFKINLQSDCLRICWKWSWQNGGGDVLQLVDKVKIKHQLQLQYHHGNAMTHSNHGFQQHQLDMLVQVRGSCESALECLFPPVKVNNLHEVGPIASLNDQSSGELESVIDKMEYESNLETVSSSSDGEEKEVRQLSEYELMRLERIKRNEQYLSQLGLMKEVPVKKKRRVRRQRSRTHDLKRAKDVSKEKGRTSSRLTIERPALSIQQQDVTSKKTKLHNHNFLLRKEMTSESLEKVELRTASSPKKQNTTCMALSISQKNLSPKQFKTTNIRRRHCDDVSVLTGSYLSDLDSTPLHNKFLTSNIYKATNHIDPQESNNQALLFPHLLSATRWNTDNLPQEEIYGKHFSSYLDNKKVAASKGWP